MRTMVGWLAAAALACCAACGTQPLDTDSRSDAAAFARMNGVSMSEAERMLAVQVASEAQADALLQALAPRVAGAYLTPGPSQHLVIRLTGSAPGGATTIETVRGPLRVEYVLGAPHSREALIAALQSRQAMIRERIPDAEGMGVDQRTGTIAVDVNVDAAGFAAYAAKVAALEQDVGVPIRLTRVSPPKPTQLP